MSLYSNCFTFARATCDNLFGSSNKKSFEDLHPLPFFSPDDALPAPIYRSCSRPPRPSSGLSLHLCQRYGVAYSTRITKPTRKLPHPARTHAQISFEQFHSTISSRITPLPPLQDDGKRVVLSGGSPFRGLFEALSPTIHRDTLAAPLAELVAQPLRSAMTRFPWALPQAHRDLLNKSGITLSDFGTKSHPHPAHKTIETNLLFNVWKFLANSPSSVMFMKPSKFEKLQKENPNFEEVLNYRLTSKDATRYPESSPHLPDLPHVDTVFMHDALMYFQPAQLLGLFESCPNIEKVYASLVVPPESDFTDLSFNPTLYKTAFVGENLVYQLENNPSHSYTQPRAAIDWLKHTSVSNGKTTFAISILESWGPVHSLLLTRGLPPVHDPIDKAFFQVPSAVLLPEPNALHLDQRHRLVPKVVYQNLFAYTRAVRTLRVTDPAGYIRTQSQKSEFDWVTSAAWDNLQHFALHTAPHRPVAHYMLFRSPWQRLKHWVRTNEFNFFMTTCGFAAPLTYLTSRLAFWLPTQQIKQFAVLGKWIIRPPTWYHVFKPDQAGFWNPLKFFKQPTPNFVFELERRQPELLHWSLRWLRDKIPSLPNCLQPKATFPYANAVSLALAAIPLGFLLYRWISGPDHPQVLHDRYVKYFHSGEWSLSWERKPLSTSAKPFLPIPTVPRALPIEKDDDIFHPALDHFTQPELDVFFDVDEEFAPNSPSPTPAPPPPPVAPVESALISAPILAEDQAPFPAHSARPSSPPLSPVDISLRPQSPFFKSILPRPGLGFNHPTPQTSAEAIDHPASPAAPFRPVRNISPEPIEFVRGEILPGTIPEPDPELPKITSILGALDSPDPLPLAPAKEEILSPLLSDTTAHGPGTTWEQLHPRDYLNECGSFQTRARSCVPSGLPYPKNDCLLQAISKATSLDTNMLWHTLCAHLPDSQLNKDDIDRHGLTTDHFTVLASVFGLKADFISGPARFTFGVASAPSSFTIKHTPGSPGHFELVSDSTPTPLSGGTCADLKNLVSTFRLDGQLLPFKEIHNYHVNVRRAKNLISNMKNGFDGVLANVNPHHPSQARARFLALDSQIDIAVSRQVPLIHLAGFAGCGKSYPVQKLLQHPVAAHHKVAVPTTELRSEWKKSIKCEDHNSWRVGTWESSLLKSARLLVIDEVYKMPRGYVDLAILSDPTIEFVILLGDPLQGEYHSSNPASNNHHICPEATHLRPFLDMYCMWSRRIPKDVASAFQIKTFNEKDGFCAFRMELPASTHLLANAQNQSRTLQQCGYQSCTIASSQGSTYSAPVCIFLDKNSKVLSPAHSLVALTRSKSGIIFTGDKSQLNPSGNLFFSLYASGQKINIPHHFGHLLQGVDIITEPITKRKTTLRGAKQEEPTSLVVDDVPVDSFEHCTSSYVHAFPLGPNDLSQDPIVPRPNHFVPNSELPSHIALPNPTVPGVLPRFSGLKPTYKDDVFLTFGSITGDGSTNSASVQTHFLPETRRPLHLDLSSSQPASADKPLPTLPTDSHCEPVYPGESFESLASSFAPAIDPEMKEIYWRSERSNQFPWLNENFQLGAQTSSVIAAKHNSKDDPTLLPASIPKRLRFRPSEEPYQISPKDELLGQLLYESLCRAYRRSPDRILPFDENLFAECINLNEFCQLTSKTQSTIMANANRSDPDWRWSAVRIFTKTQHKVNDNSIFGSWKACQTLALAHDAVILLLGPVKKYQRLFDAADCPSNLYIHAGHTPFEMSAWCQQNLHDCTHVANDYTAFDQSQHGEAVVLERKKMERLSIPQHLIDLHVHLKTNVSTQFGPLTCMRLTGEPGTYDDNTDYNLAVMFSEYSITNQAVMVSGDDSLIDSLPPQRFSWPAIEPMLSLRFKKEYSKYSLFCGYFVGPAGACRAPLALFVKLMMAIDSQTLDDKLASYLSEFSVGHSLGQDMWTLIPIEYVSYQSACFDLFCRKAPASWKVALKIGPPPQGWLDSLSSSLKYVSSAVFAMLSFAQRRLFLQQKQNLSSSVLPLDSSFKGELLPEFQSEFDTDQFSPALSSLSTLPALASTYSSTNFCSLFASYGKSSRTRPFVDLIACQT
ncbi:polyprotein [Citrus virus C]|nr:polyprotein [Citrus virus C]